MARLFFLFNAFILLLSHFCPVDASDKWIPVPIVTTEEKKHGLAGGEGFQMVHSIVYSSMNASILYLGTDTSQVWKSVDGGVTWQSKNKGFRANGARSIIVDPLNSNIAFAIGFLGPSYKAAMPYGDRLQGVYRTINGGETWQLVREADFYRQVAKGNLLAYGPSSSAQQKTTIIYAGSYEEGLLLSEDGGESWRVVGFEGVHISEIKMNPSDSDELFVATESGLFKYNNSKITRLGKDLPMWPRTLAISANQPNVIYAALSKAGVYKSEDGGYTFHSLNILPDFLGVNFTNVATSPVNANIVLAKAHQTHYRSPFYSHDGGKTWHQSSFLENTNSFLRIGEEFWFSSPFAFHPKKPLVVYTISNGRGRVLKSQDGGKTWEYSGTGFTGGRMRDIGFGNSGKAVYFLTDHGVWLTENEGMTFDDLKVKKILEAKSSRSGDIRGSTIVASVGTWKEKGLAVSDDLGKRWKIADVSKNSYPFVKFHPQNDNIVYAGSYRSRSRGEKWEKLDFAIRAFYPQNGDIVYAVSQRGDKSCFLLKSMDQGDTWHKMIPEGAFAEKSIQEIAVSPIDENIIYVATANGFWVYEAGKWQLKSEKEGLSKDAFNMRFISSVIVDVNHPERIFVGRRSPGRGQSNGVFRSLDWGKTWENITFNLGPDLTVWAIEIDPNDSNVYIGTSLGTWKLSSQKSSLTVNIRDITWHTETSQKK